MPQVLKDNPYVKSPLLGSTHPYQRQRSAHRLWQRRTVGYVRARNAQRRRWLRNSFPFSLLNQSKCSVVLAHDVGDGLRQIFREDILLDLEASSTSVVRPSTY
jgi:hypothetical protein